MDNQRRNFLCGLGCMAIGGLGISTVYAAEKELGQAPAEENKIVAPQRFAQVGGPFGWQPHKLDPAECEEVAYEGYWHNAYACGYGTFYSIIGLMGEKFGAPYNQFPFTMLEANKGGISDWGTICGALYGAAAAFALFWGRKERTPMVNELFRWYEITKLPMYNPGDKAQGVKGPIPSNVSDSVLCHLSVSKWCYANNVEATSKKRNERCGRLTADVSRKAVEILNRKIELGPEFKCAIPKQKAVEYCGKCHQTKGKKTNWAKGIMDCTPCHSGGPAVSNKFVDHP